jgi:enterochelin esterase family protein
VGFVLVLERGQFARLRVEQRGIDVVVQTSKPDGRRLAAVDAGGARDTEWVSIPATESGSYSVRVYPFVRDAAPGEFMIRIEEILSAEQYAERQLRARCESPRLVELWKATRAMGEPAVEAFWNEVRSKTPLMEPFPADTSQRMLTFLWRGDVATRSVSLSRGPLSYSWAAPLDQLEGTDVWYRTAILPADSRFTYAFLVNAPFTDWRRWVSANRIFADYPELPDPLNPRTHTGGSVAELPAAPAPHWLERRQDTPRGTVQADTLESKLLHMRRALAIYTPPGYDRLMRPCDLLVVFDGNAYKGDSTLIPTPRILDNLIAAGRIRPIIAVFVDNHGLRSRDLTCYPPFADFLADELVPWLRARFRLSRDPARAVLAGSSAGGLCAAYSAFRHPDKFGGVLSQSGAFCYYPGFEEKDATYEIETGWLIREFAKASRRPLRLWLEAGRLESWGFWSIVDSNWRMRDVLTARGYEFAYQEYSGGHDYLCWQGTFGDGLAWLLGEQDPKRPAPRTFNR